MLFAAFTGDRVGCRVEVQHIADGGVLQTSGDQDRLPGVAVDVTDVKTVSIAQRSDSAPYRIAVADFDCGTVMADFGG